MKAQRIHRFGPPDVITFEDVARPVPGAGEVLVRVAAAGVGAWDAWIRAGKSVLPQPLPLTLGSDLSGHVEAIGPGVTGFALGEDVFGVTNARFTGAYADFALASANRIATRSHRLSDVEAASLPVIAVTAWQMLFDHAHVDVGQTVLVHGAAGNVGAFAVQLARLQRAHVIATAGTDDVAYVRSLGAEQVVDFRRERFEDLAGPVDAVIDTVGGDVQERSFAVLKRGGVLISAVSEPDARLAERHGVRAGFMLVDVGTAALEQIAERIDAGALVPRVGAVLPLADARTAHEMLAGTRPRPGGKIVLRVG